MELSYLVTNTKNYKKYDILIIFKKNKRLKIKQLDILFYI